MTFLLIILLIAFAIAGGFLGDLLQVAGWLILLLAAVGAAIGFFLYSRIRKLLHR